MSKTKQSVYRGYTRVPEKFKKHIATEPRHLIGDEESSWIKYIKKSLHSIWSLNDDGLIYVDRKNNDKVRTDQQDLLVHYLIEDISNFSIPYTFKSNAAYIWEILRQITIARIKRDATFLASFAERLENIENYSMLRFNTHVKCLILAAKLECYVTIYFLIKQNSTTEEIVGYDVDILFSLLLKSYEQLLHLTNCLSKKKSPTDYYNFPCNTHLTGRVLSLVENSFVDADDDEILEEIKSNFVLFSNEKIVDESFVMKDRQYINKVLSDSFKKSNVS